MCEIWMNRYEMRRRVEKKKTKPNWWKHKHLKRRMANGTTLDFEYLNYIWNWANNFGQSKIAIWAFNIWCWRLMAASIHYTLYNIYAYILCLYSYYHIFTAQNWLCTFWISIIDEMNCYYYLQWPAQAPNKRTASIWIYHY